MNKGFSLIELLVVVAIIGILAAVGVMAYSGYTDRAERGTCLDQYQQIKKIIMHKFLEADVGGEGIEYVDGNCFQHFLTGSSQTTDIAQEMNKDSMLLHCNATPGGSEHYYWWHIRRLGFRNCSNFGMHPYGCWDCVGKDCNAMASPGVCFEGIEASNHVKGQIIFACGIQAGLTDLNTCYIGAKITDDEIIESYISK